MLRRDRDDGVVVTLLLACTFLSALIQPVSPFPRDGWFETQYRLFGRFPGEDDYTPIAAPAIFYKLIHWLALGGGLDLEGEMYLASLAQNGLLFLSACLVYHTCKRLSSGRIAGFTAIAYLLFVLASGLAQAFWSENVAIAMFAAVLYLNTRIHDTADDPSRAFWLPAFVSSLLTGLLVVTRMTPVLLIPGLFLLLFRRLSRKRLLGYTALACLTTGLMLGGMLAANQLRFGRAELTNSSGRHLWQGANPIVDEALAQSPEYQELKALNPELQYRNWYEVRLPDDRRQEFDGEELLGRLARQAIRSQPLLYLRLGLTKFLTTIFQSPYRLGSDLKGNHHLLAADPLHVDALLPPLGVSALRLPVSAAMTAGNAVAAVYSFGRMLYPILMFLVLTTGSAFIVRRESPAAGALPGARWWHLSAGILLLGMIYFTYIPEGRLLTWAIRGLCVAVLLLQVAVIGGGRQALVDDRPAMPPPDRVTYAFLALMLFGSLWLSWQTETKNTRNVLPYLPFLAAMVAMALRYWCGAAGVLTMSTNRKPKTPNIAMLG